MVWACSIASIVPAMIAHFYPRANWLGSGRLIATYGSNIDECCGRLVFGQAISLAISRNSNF